MWRASHHMRRRCRSGSAVVVSSGTTTLSCHYNNSSRRIGGSASIVAAASRGVRPPAPTYFGGRLRTRWQQPTLLMINSSSFFSSSVRQRYSSPISSYSGSASSSVRSYASAGDESKIQHQTTDHRHPPPPPAHGSRQINSNYKNSRAGHLTRKTSVVQERAAASQHEYLERVTRHILDQQHYSTLQVGSAEIRSAFHYWISKPVRDLMAKRKQNQSTAADLPLEKANQILDWLMTQYREHAQNEQERMLVASVFQYTVSHFNNNRYKLVNSGLCRLMSLHLHPLQGTRADLQDNGGNTGHRQIPDAKRQLDALLKATKIHETLQYVHDSPDFPRMRPDAQYYQSLLNLYGKRCKFLTMLGPVYDKGRPDSPRRRRGISLASPEFIDAVGGCQMAVHCIAAGKQLLEQMREDPDLPNPEFIHYAMLISMMSYATRQQTGLADEALRIVEGLDVSMEEAVALYNPVLIAYQQEASFLRQRQEKQAEWEAQTKFEALFKRMVESPNLRADEISYSLMLKFYQNLDQAPAAQAFLDEMMRTDSSKSPAPTRMHCNTVLNAWAKSTEPDADQRAMELLRRMEEGPAPLQPDKISYTSALDALLRRANVDAMMEQMHAVLERFERNSKLEHRPDDITYNIIFHNMLRRIKDQHDPEVRVQIAEQMEDFLRKLRAESDHFLSVAGGKIYRNYNDCFHAWAATDSPRSTKRVIRLLHDMQADTLPAARPNGQTYESILATVFRDPNPESLESCRQVFEEIEASPGVPRTISLLNAFIAFLITCPFPGSIEQADTSFVNAILERLRVQRGDAFTYAWVFFGLFDYLNKENDTQIKVTIARRIEKLFRSLLETSDDFISTEGVHMYTHYNECLRAWAFCRSSSSKENVLRLWHEMEEKGKSCSNDKSMCLKPDINTYEHVLTSLSRAPEVHSVQTAREIFRKLEDSGYTITISALNLFLRILVKSRVDGSLKEAEMILRDASRNYLAGQNSSICPNQSSFEILLEGYIRLPGTESEAEKLLDEMVALSEKTENPKLLPTVDMYKQVMDCWSRSEAFDAMEHVERVFEKMALRSKPGSKTYASLQSAWITSQRPDAPSRVEEILVRMRNDHEAGINPFCRPDVENFTLVIRAWALSKQEGSAEHAYAILQRLEDLAKQGAGEYNYLRPTASCYEYILMAWAFSKSPHAGGNALAFLDRLKRTKGPEMTLPNQTCYNYAITAVARTDDGQKAVKCYNLLKEMQSFKSGPSRFAPPTNDTFLYVLNACSASTGSAEGKKAALEIAVKTIQEYREFTSAPRVLNYAQFLSAVCRLAPSGEIRDKAVIQALVEGPSPCPDSILRTATIRTALEDSVSPDAVAIIVGIATSKTEIECE